MMPSYCTACFRMEDDVATCGRHPLPCPEPIAVDPTTTVVLWCGPCDKKMAVPVAALMRGRTQGMFTPCQRDNCHATVVSLSAPDPLDVELAPPPPAPAPKAPTTGKKKPASK